MLKDCLQKQGKRLSPVDREEIENSYNQHLETKSEHEAAVAALTDYHKRLFDDTNTLRKQVGLSAAPYKVPVVSKPAEVRIPPGAPVSETLHKASTPESKQLHLEQKGKLTPQLLLNFDFKNTAQGLEISSATSELNRRMFETRSKRPVTTSDAAFLEPAVARDLASRYQGFIDRYQARLPQSIVQRLQDYQKSLRQVSKQGKIVYTFDEAVRHEQLHKLSYASAAVKRLTQRVHDLPKFARTNRKLIEKAHANHYVNYGYVLPDLRKSNFSPVELGQAATHIEEMAVSIMDGDHATLGLSSAEAAEYLDNWFTAYKQAHGREALRNFEKFFNGLNEFTPTLLALRRINEGNKEKSTESGQGILGEREPVAGEEAQSPPERNRGERERATIRSAEEANLVNHMDDRYYPVKHKDANIRAAQERIEQVGLAQAMFDAVQTAPAGQRAEHTAFQMETVHLLNRQARQAMETDDKVTARAKLDAAQSIVQVIAEQGTDYGQAISQLAEWQVDGDPEAVTGYVQKRRNQFGYPEPLTPEQVKDLQDKAQKTADLLKTVDDLRKQISDMEDRLEGKAPSPRVARSKNPNVDRLQKIKDDLRKRMESNPLLSPTEFTQPFFSQVERTLEKKMPNKASAEQVRNILKETKKEEREWLGLDQWLDDHPNPTKQEALDFVKANNVELVVKHLKGGGSGMDRFQRFDSDKGQDLLADLDKAAESFVKKWTDLEIDGIADLLPDIHSGAIEGDDFESVFEGAVSYHLSDKFFENYPESTGDDYNGDYNALEAAYNKLKNFLDSGDSESDAAQYISILPKVKAYTPLAVEEAAPLFMASKNKKLLAPNGKPSNLPEILYHEVRTPEFKSWFGDWEKSPKTASKVVDENGEPKVVYHIGKANLEGGKLDPERGEFGLHFGDAKTVSTFKGKRGESGYPVFLNIRSPKRETDFGYWSPSYLWSRVEEVPGYLKTLKKSGLTDQDIDEIRGSAEMDDDASYPDIRQAYQLVTGSDGIIYYNLWEGARDTKTGKLVSPSDKRYDSDQPGEDLEQLGAKKFEEEYGVKLSDSYIAFETDQVRSVFAQPGGPLFKMTPDQKRDLVDYTALNILDDMPLKEVMEDLKKVAPGLTDEERADIHLAAWDMLYPHKTTPTKTARAQIRMEHLREIHRTRKATMAGPKAPTANMTRMTEIADDLGTDPKVLHTALLLESGAANTANEASQMVRQLYPDTTPGDALNIASLAAKFRKEAKDQIAQENEEIRRQKAEAEGKLRQENKRKNVAQRELLNRIHGLERPPPSYAQRIARVYKNALVSAFQTAARNLVASTSMRGIMALTDLTELALNKALTKAGRELGDEAIAPDTPVRDILGLSSDTKSILDAVKKNTTEAVYAYARACSVLDEFPTYYEQIFRRYSSDIDVLPPREGKVAGAAEWAMRALEQTYDKASTIHKLQEFFIRSQEFNRVLQMRLAGKGQSLQQLIDEGKTNEIDPEDVARATRGALQVVFALKPDRTTLYGRLIDTYEKKVPALLSPFLITFPKFSYNAVTFVAAYTPLIGILKAAGNGGSGYGGGRGGKGGGRGPGGYWDGFKNLDSRVVAQQLVGTVIFLVALLFVRAFGDDEKWYMLRVPGMTKDGQPLYIDIRGWHPFTAFIFMANKINRLMEGQPMFSSPEGPFWEISDALIGISSRNLVDNKILETLWGTGKAITGLGDDKEWERVSYLMQQQLGEMAGGMLRPLKVIKDLVAQFDDFQNTQQDLIDQPVMQGVSRNLPFANSLTGAPIKRNYVTGEPEKAVAPGLKIFGVNLVDPKQHQEVTTAAVAKLRKLESDTGEKPREVLPEAQRASQLKTDFFKAMRQAGSDTEKQKQIIDKFKQAVEEGKLKETQAKSMENRIGKTEFQSRLKEADWKGIIQVLKVATPSEKASARDIIEQKWKNSTVQPDDAEEQTLIGLGFNSPTGIKKLKRLKNLKSLKSMSQ